jgi:hypothetical protein
MGRKDRYECKSSIKILDGPELSLKIRHGVVMTEDYSFGDEHVRSYRAPSQKTLLTATSVIVIKPNEATPLGLEVLHNNAPLLLRQMVEDLKKYKTENDLDFPERRLVEYAIREMREIIKKKR